MTRKDNYHVWNITGYGYLDFQYVTQLDNARPSVHLSSGVKILSGTGLPHDPYVVGL